MVTQRLPASHGAKPQEHKEHPAVSGRSGGAGERTPLVVSLGDFKRVRHDHRSNLTGPVDQPRCNAEPVTSVEVRVLINAHRSNQAGVDVLQEQAIRRCRRSRFLWKNPHVRPQAFFGGASADLTDSARWWRPIC